MSEAVRHLRKAVAVIADEGVPLQRRVHRAADLFWAAMYESDLWPEELLAHANSIVELILADGPIRTTVQRMDEATAVAICQRIAAFAAEFQQAMAATRSTNGSGRSAR